jgi:transposase
MEEVSGLDTCGNEGYPGLAGLAEPLPQGEVRYWGQLANDAASVDRLMKRLGKDGRELVVCYEAGPCGYGLYRQLQGRPGIMCQVVAPSMRFTPPSP